MELDTLKELVARSCRILGKLNLTKEPSGHVSARVPGQERILIKARGPGESGLRFVSARDIITVDWAGKKVEGPEDLESPQEVFIHTWLYRTRPDIQSVVHIHPATVVLFTVCQKPLLPIYGAYDPSGLRLLIEGISNYKRSITVTNDKLGEEFAQAVGTTQACLMRGHGITTVGGGVEEATLTAIKLNELAQMNYRASLLGKPEPIPAEDIEAMVGRARGRTGRMRTDSTWRYYCRLLDE
jgi:ribulose-5-phosphate 4-epimerase/fuculose-1-phosphate aldolase